MRKLTQQEIENAPDWAVSYTEVANIITWYPTKDKQLVVMPYAQPIPRKEFNIDTYEPDDIDIIICSSSDDQINFATRNHDTFFMTKDDYIAGAKHFKLTAEDLK